jgi:hypothetical protein
VTTTKDIQNFRPSFGFVLNGMNEFNSKVSYLKCTYLICDSLHTLKFNSTSNVDFLNNTDMLYAIHKMQTHYIDIFCLFPLKMHENIEDKKKIQIQVQS